MAFHLVCVFRNISFSRLCALKSSVNRKELFFNKVILKTHLSICQISRVTTEATASKSAKVGYVSGESGLLAAAIFTGFLPNKLQAGKSDGSEVWNTPVAKNIDQNRSASGKFAKKIC